MIKIAFIQPRVSYYNGGDERRCLKLLEEIMNHTDYNIILYTLKIDSVFQTDSYKKFIFNFSNNFSRIEIKELLIENEYLFIDNNPLQDPNKWDVESFRFNSYLFKELDKDSPDVIWSFYLSEGFLHPTNIPSIHNQSGYFCDYVPIRESIFRQFDAIVCISKNVENKWNKKMSRPFKKSYVLYSGPLVDLPNNYKKDFNKDITNILYAGRLIESKGVQDLIEALSLIQYKIGEWHLNIVGSGPYKDYLNKIAEELIPGKFSFIDFTDDIQKFYEISDICVFPSHEFEGLMNVVIESMYFGCPVIATSGNGNEEIITDSVDGYIIDSRDVQLLSNKILSLISDKDNLRSVSQNAKEKITNNFSWSKIISSLDVIVRDVIVSFKNK